MNKTYVFIDASNLWQSQKAKGKLLDLDKLIRYLKSKHQADSINTYYYTAYPKEGTRDYSIGDIFSFYTFLKKQLGFVVRKKELKQIKNGDIIEEKGNMDVKLTIDVVNLISKYDTAILFTGDSDFLALVAYVRERNKKVFIYSSRNNISSELLTGSDGYTDILKIKEDIWRNNLIRRQTKTTLSDEDRPRM